MDLVLIIMRILEVQEEIKKLLVIYYNENITDFARNKKLFGIYYSDKK